MQLSFQQVLEALLLSQIGTAEQRVCRSDALYAFRVFSDMGCILVL